MLWTPNETYTEEPFEKEKGLESAILEVTDFLFLRTFTECEVGILPTYPFSTHLNPPVSDRSGSSQRQPTSLPPLATL